MIYNNIKMTLPITVLSLNINFKGLTPERIQKIIALIHHHNPTIIFLQEVPREMVEHFLKLNNYPHHFGATFQHPYDTLILSRFPCIRYDRIPLPETQSNRNLLYAQIVLPSEQMMIVGTFHCDSVFNPPQSELLKIDQLRFIESIMKSKPFIIAGDTNLIDNQKITSPILNEHNSHPTFKKNRFDRFFSSRDDFTNSPTEVIGDSTHSDHCGLIASFTLLNQSAQ
jgi:endonuclease/exonuclease/phosphatase (EEP) superfamily protein YafD